MKAPNGFGSVTRLAGRRRKPFAAVLTVKGGNAKRVRRYLGYYKTKAEALTALADYHKAPYDLDASRATFADAYAMWLRGVGGNVPGYANSCYNHLVPLHGVKLSELRRLHVQAAIDAAEVSPSTKNKMKVLVRKVLQMAVDGEALASNVATGIKVPAAPRSELHQPFSAEELAELWRRADDLGARVMLALCYTGMRPVELCLIKREDVHLAERYMVGGVKTAAGRNRVIPIHERIVPFIEGWLAEGGEWLFTPGTRDYGARATEQEKNRLTQSVQWLCGRSEALGSLPRRHLPHDGRHTCITRLNDAEVNERTIQLIVGHSGSGVTQSVYTHKTIAQLIEAINRIQP